MAAIKRFAVFVAFAVSLLNGGIANADELTIPDDQLHNVNPSAYATTISNIRLDEPAILNDPVNAWDGFKRIVSMAEPSGDALWNVLGGSGEFKAGSSIRFYSAENLDIPVVKDLDFRMGYFEAPGLYGTISLALDRVTGNEVLRFAHLGWFAGADFDKDRDILVTGPVVGAKLTF